MTEQQEFDQKSVVTSFLRHGGKIMLVRRSERVRTFRGRWGGISGYLESEDPLEQAQQEIREETGSRVRDAISGEGTRLKLDEEILRCWIALKRMPHPRCPGPKA